MNLLDAWTIMNPHRMPKISAWEKSKLSGYRVVDQDEVSTKCSNIWY